MGKQFEFYRSSLVSQSLKIWATTGNHKSSRLHEHFLRKCSCTSDQHAPGRFMIAGFISNFCLLIESFLCIITELSSHSSFLCHVLRSSPRVCTGLAFTSIFTWKIAEVAGLERRRTKRTELLQSRTKYRFPIGSATRTLSPLSFFTTAGCGNPNLKCLANPTDFLFLSLYSGALYPFYLHLKYFHLAHKTFPIALSPLVRIRASLSSNIFTRKNIWSGEIVAWFNRNPKVFKIWW